MGGFPSIKTFFLLLFKQLFPPACPLCGRPLSATDTDVLCDDCLAGFTPIPSSHCPLCALPFTGKSNRPHLCGRCIRNRPAYEKVYSVGLYDQSLRRAIHHFKFNRKVGLDRSLGVLLEREVEADLPLDVVIPVPLHHKRLQQRSYNQALLLAREFAKIRNLPVLTDLLLKVKETQSQQGLSAKQRATNLQGAFAIQRSIENATVLLIDDVLTTGATADACCQVLLTGGAKAVYVAVIGRAA
ncbi:ComF family protein [Desulfuromusa kysingii]|nr:ComF family protein [Desulfuromusa kysingii]